MAEQTELSKLSKSLNFSAVEMIDKRKWHDGFFTNVG